MDESPPDEIIEISSNRWILLVFEREWPRYVVEWSVRERAKESDFPVVGGRVVREPDGKRPAEEIWNEAREIAIEEANGALGQHDALQGSGKKGLLARIFGR